MKFLLLAALTMTSMSAMAYVASSSKSMIGTLDGNGSKVSAIVVTASRYYDLGGNKIALVSDLGGNLSYRIVSLRQADIQGGRWELLSASAARVAIGSGKLGAAKASPRHAP